MERLEAIEQLIEAGREEAPRIVAERSREAVETVEAGVANALAAARERLRPEPRRPSTVRLVFIGLAAAVALTIAGVVLAAAVERGQRWLRERRRGQSDYLGAAGRRASDALESGSGARERVSIPVTPLGSGPSDGMPDEGDVEAGDSTERVATS